jgi:tetratricopeptide (TPR) repeat protein
MNIKPVYIYGILTIFVAIILIISSWNSSSGNRVISDSGNKMPADDLHNSLRNKLNQSPGSSNVTSETLRKLEELKHQFESMPDDTLRIREYADFLVMSHRHIDAIPLYEKVLSKDSNRIDILFSLTFIYYNQSNMNKAEELTNKILFKDPANVQAIYNSGAIAASKGNKVEARKIWENLITRYPHSETTELAKTSLNKLN